MPTYEYVCAKCGHQFEIFQPITDDPLRTCPKDHCRLDKWGKGKVRRLIGAGAGLIFKGSGFYTTDYRSESYKEAAKKESGAAKPAGETKTEKSGATGGVEKKSPSKPETKPKPSSAKT
jgi:putative FmdB family regulatory protein